MRGGLGEIDAIVLAGGLGSRLRAALPDRQKVLAPVAGRAFIERILDLLAASGCRRAVLAAGYRAEEVTAWAAGRSRPGFEIAVSVEEQPLGTGGAVRLALPLTASDPVLVLNGDSFLAADLAALLAFHRDRAAALSMVLTRVADASRFGAVACAADGAVSDFVEKGGAAGPGRINAGIYLFARAAAEAIPADGPVSLERQVFPRLCGRGLYGLVQDEPFIDIGTPASWREAAGFFAGISGVGGSA